MVDEEFLPFAQNSFDLVVSSLRCVLGSGIGHFTATCCVYMNLNEAGFDYVVIQPLLSTFSCLSCCSYTN